MDIKEYFERNLPNVNFNILPQLFEEEGIELTEEIVEYLKMTPWNTNWSVLSGLGGTESGESIEILYDKDLELTSNPLGVGGYEYSKSVKDEVFDKLKDGDKVWITVGATRVEATVTEKISSDGYTVTREFNLKDTLYIKTAEVGWDRYGQSPKAKLQVNTVGNPGTYNVKIEKVAA